MTDPLSFPSTTARFGLPLLFAAQAQKEPTVNAAHALIDLLLHPAIQGEATAAPATPEEGTCWLVGSGGQGVFAGHDGELAGFVSGTWIFAAPRDGLEVIDRATDQKLVYIGGWRREAAPAEPTGGSTVDTEARAAIVAILQLFRRTGILAAA